MEFYVSCKIMEEGTYGTPTPKYEFQMSLDMLE